MTLNITKLFLERQYRRSLTLVSITWETTVVHRIVGMIETKPHTCCSHGKYTKSTVIQIFINNYECNLIKKVLKWLHIVIYFIYIRLLLFFQNFIEFIFVDVIFENQWQWKGTRLWHGCKPKNIYISIFSVHYFSFQALFMVKQNMNVILLSSHGIQHSQFFVIYTRLEPRSCLYLDIFIENMFKHNQMWQEAQGPHRSPESYANIFHINTCKITYLNWN
jgi:hypothetical protein